MTFIIVTVLFVFLMILLAGIILKVFKRFKKFKYVCAALLNILIVHLPVLLTNHPVDLSRFELSGFLYRIVMPICCMGFAAFLIKKSA